MNGDPWNTSYSSFSAVPSVADAGAFGDWLGVPLGQAGGLLLRPELAVEAIRERQWRALGVEARAAGFAPCRRCGGAVRPAQMCPCGVMASGVRLLTGDEALSQLEFRSSP